MNKLFFFEDISSKNIDNIFDSHAHYNDGKFSETRHEILKSLQKNGVDKVINVGASVKESYESAELAKQYNFVYASVGVHPYEALNLENGYLDELAELSKQKKIVAIGEVGLDYHYPNVSDSVKEVQKKVFEEQLSLASELDLPVIIHSREADKDVLNVLKKFRLRGVVHCFSSSSEIAEILVKMGYYLGFTGVVTFKNNNKQLKSLSVVPLEKILVETDCPYMAPEPHRGQICTSLMLPHIIEKIAIVKSKLGQEIADITNQNACDLFNIK